MPYRAGPVYEDFFDELKSVAQAGARIDFGFHFIIATRQQIASVPRYVREFGVPTMKLFMNIRGSEGDRLGLPPIDDGFMYELLDQLHASGGMMCPHPDNIEIAWSLGKRLREQDPDGKRGAGDVECHGRAGSFRPHLIRRGVDRRARGARRRCR